jgi:hypothetical protein
MTRSAKRIVFIGGLAALSAALAMFVFLQQRGGSLPLTRTFTGSPTGFTVRYPEDWDASIPIQGVMLIGPSDTLFQAQPGPTFTVQRLGLLSSYGSLDDALDLYLRRGPLRGDRDWAAMSASQSTTLDGRSAMSVMLQGRDNDTSPELRAEITATTADNGIVYIVVLTAPTADWETASPTLAAMRETLHLLE